MAIFTPKKAIDGANNSEMITSSPYVYNHLHQMSDQTLYIIMILHFSENCNKL